MFSGVSALIEPTNLLRMRNTALGQSAPSLTNSLVSHLYSFDCPRYCGLPFFGGFAKWAMGSRLRLRGWHCIVRSILTASSGFPSCFCLWWNCGGAVKVKLNSLGVLFIPMACVVHVSSDFSHRFNETAAIKIRDRDLHLFYFNAESFWWRCCGLRCKLPLSPTSLDFS